MLPDITKFPINWKDGMKVSSSEFIALENAFNDLLRDSRSIHLNEDVYGLLPSSRDDGDYPKFSYEFQNSSIKVKVEECRALTLSGERIEVTKSLKNELQLGKDVHAFEISSPGIYDIVLEVEPFSRDDFGLGITSKHIIPKFNFSVGPKGKEINSSKRLIVERLQADNLHSPPKKVENFIPASYCLNSHRTLRHVYCDKVVGSLQECLNIAPKIIRKTRLLKKAVQGDEADIAYNIAQNIGLYLSSNASMLGPEAHRLPTVYHYNFVVNLTETLEFTLFYLSSEDKQISSDLYQFINSFQDSDERYMGEGRDVLASYKNLLNNPFNQNDLFKCFNDAKVFADSLKELFLSLSEHPYQEIGDMGGDRRRRNRRR